jgi:hypothetical protein
MNLISEWKNTGSYFKNNIHSIFSDDKVSKVDEARWNAFGPKKEELPAKLFYNKGTVLLDDAFSLLTNLGPRIYFQSGDGTRLSPPKVEPIAIPLFAFWVLGIIDLIKNKKFRLFIWSFLIAIAVYIFGQRNMAYLFPLSIIYSWIAVCGIESLKSTKFKKTVYILISIYGLYLLGRIFLL